MKAEVFSPTSGQLFVSLPPLPLSRLSTFQVSSTPKPRTRATPTSFSDRLSGYRQLDQALKARGDDVRWVETALKMGIEFRRAVSLYSVLGRLTGLHSAHIEFIRAGNAAVFQDAYPRVQQLLKGSVLKGETAREWDHGILNIEQNRLQPLYERMHNAHNQLEHFERQLTTPGRAERWLLPTLTAQPFRGRLLNVQDRIDYGMRLLYTDKKLDS